MSEIKRVVIAGGNGSLGSVVLQSLASAGFEVSAFVRKAGKITKQPANVKEVVVDYANHKSLVSALQGQDAVVVTFGTEPGFAASTKALIEAAVEAKTVQRFIPSSFGSDLRNPIVRALPVFKDKVEIEELLKKKSTETNLSYTFIQNNAFLDWGLKNKFILDPVAGKATLWDGGDITFSTTSLTAVGQGVVGTLRHPAETKNRYVYIAEAAVTMKQLVEIAKELTPNKKWTVVEGSTAEVVKKSNEALAKGIYNDPAVWVGYIFRACFTKDAGGHFTNTDNKLLGIHELSPSELKQVIKDTLAKIPGAL